jgi:hypothetical protein
MSSKFKSSKFNSGISVAVVLTYDLFKSRIVGILLQLPFTFHAYSSGLATTVMCPATGQRPMP